MFQFIPLLYGYSPIKGEVLVMAMLDRIEAVPRSLIREFFDIASKMKNVLSLGIGEPDFDTPSHIKEYAKEALDKGYTHYGPNIGLPVLREAVAEKLEKFNGISVDPEREVMITVGANMPMFMSLSSILRSGEEVLIPMPAFVTYAPATILAGGRPVMVPTREEDEFKAYPEILEKYVSEKTRVLVINTPNNPTGAVYTRRELEELADFAVEHDLMVISDEVYEFIVYDGYKHTSIASLNGMFERTVTINGFSKTFAMTGWRIGYVAAPSWVIDRMLKIQMYTVTCPVTFIQYAVAKALRDPRSWEAVEEMRREYERRRDFVWKRLNEIGLPVSKPHGAFYIFPSIKNTGLASMEFSKRLLEEARVAVVPGHAFGEAGEGYVRISYAVSIEKLEEAMNRIEVFLKKL